jgi:xanthine dehydrogenase accessory factor
VRAQRVDTPAALQALLDSGAAIPIVPCDRAPALLATLEPAAMVDARMRKRERAPCQLHEAPLTIGLGPGFRAGETVHAVVETNWGERLGAVVWTGEAEPYTGQPRAVAGYARERYLYAPHAGRFRTELVIGAPVAAGQLVGWVDATPLRAPIAGTLRGLTRDGVPVAAGAKVVDIDPTADPARAVGIGERPRRIAEGVLRALRERGLLPGAAARE